MTLRATQGWLGHRSIASTAVDRPWRPNRFKDFWRERAVSAWKCRSGIGSRGGRSYFPFDRTFCRLPTLSHLRSPSVAPIHPPDEPARKPRPSLGLSFRYLSGEGRMATWDYRSDVWCECHGARLRDRWSRGTIPHPPTPHRDCAKADNDRDQDREDGNSCIILTLPVAEWVSWCATGFERHNSSDRKLSRAAVSHTRTRKGRNSGHHPRLMTGVDRRDRV
jgi:hypothetical protein